jgi:hypothetical protein
LTRRRFDDLFDRAGDLWPVGVARILLGPVVVLHLWGTVGDALGGRTYQDRFHVPFFAWLPDPPEPVYAGLLVVGVAAGVAMAAGRRTRLATTVGAAVVAYNLLLDQTGFRHNRAFLALVLGGLALAGRSDHVTLRTVFAPVGRVSRPDTLWPLWLLRALVSSVYLASGVSKLLHEDWRSGLVLHDRVVRYRHHIDGLPFDGVLTDVLTSPGFHDWLAPLAIATELFVGVALWSRARLAAVWVAVAFHASIEISASVQVFSLAAVAALAIWATPAVGRRAVEVRPGSAWPWIVRHLDWLARFTMADGTRVVLRDADGRVWEGRAAAIRILARLPLTFFFAAPVLLAHRAGARLRRWQSTRA